MRRFAALLVILLLTALTPAVTHAQSPDWQEKRTTYFAITYVTSQADEANRYARFVDAAYTDLSAIFSLSIQTPVTLRLYPDERSYVAVNPLAEKVSGVIAHATSGRGRREIAIAVVRTQGMSEEMLINNVRHELTHLIVSEMSGDELPVGFHEGIAQYVEKPIAREQQSAVTRLRQASQANQVMTWADLNAPGGAYSSPAIAYPQSLSMVGFLVDRYGFGKLVDFVKANASSPGYRTAMETVYGVSADQLEAQWRAYLPEWLAGRFAVNALFAYDLSPARTLLEQGTYTAAKEELDRAVYLLRTTGQADRLAEAQGLLARAEKGIAAGATTAEARKALEARNYVATRELVAQARADYAELGDTRRAEELRLYESRALDALLALDQLRAAEGLVRGFRYPEARDAIYEAAQTLGELGDSSGVSASQQLLAEMDSMQQRVGMALAGLGGLLLGLNILRRTRQPDPHRGWL